MEAALISMNAEEATVAEGVKVYKRAEVEQQYAVLSQQVMADSAKLQELDVQYRKIAEEIKAVKQRLDATNYAMELYSALITAFNRDYPRATAAIPTPEQVVAEEPLVEPEEEVVEEVPVEELAEEVPVEEVPVVEEVAEEVPVEEVLAEEVPAFDEVTPEGQPIVEPLAPQQ